MLYGESFGKSEACSNIERYLAEVPKCETLSSDRSMGIASWLEYEVVGCSAGFVAACEFSPDGDGVI